MKSGAIFAAAILVLALAGCAGNPMRSYNSELKNTVGSLAGNNVAQAQANLDKANTGDKDLLYFFEQGELFRLNNKFPESRDAWLQADEKIRIWEDEAKTNPQKLLGYIGAVIVNDKMMRYDGQDYEKVMLSTNLALDHILLGNWDAARTEIKKMHEREAIIAEIRSKEVDKVEAEAKSKNIKTEIKEIKGYPVETLNDPEVTRLKNSYQSAFGHYLAGFVYEALNEPSLAAPGYRKAIELRPGLKALEEGLRNLDRHTGARARRSRLTDTLFVIESGTVPPRESISLPIPIPNGNVPLIVPVSFPVIKAAKIAPVPPMLLIDKKTKLKVTTVTNVDAMARRALKSDMPGIILRTVIRATVKTVAQDMAKKQGGDLAGAITAVAAVATESADERGWRTLPANISIARAQIPPGKHAIMLGDKQFDIEVGGRYAVFPLRIIDAATYLAQPEVPQITISALSLPEEGKRVHHKKNVKLQAQN